MSICISREGCTKNGIGVGEALLLLIILEKANIDEAQNNLIDKGYITAEMDNLFNQIGWRVTNKGKEMINSIIIDSDKKQEPESRLIDLAKRLKDIFPKGKKDGTNYYWAEGVALIVRRLKMFFKKYGESLTETFNDEFKSMSEEDFNKFIDDRIIQAATKYIEGFNGNYQYMKLLKYFIFKEKLGVAGEVEGESELINYMENAGQEDDLRNDWTSTLR